MAIELKTYEQILGDMVRKVIADTNLNDVNAGSVLLTLLEAAAQVDFENNAAILNVLELLSIDATVDSDLDARGADLGLERIPAVRSTGSVTFTDSSVSKRSTGLYQVKPAPIAGSTVLFVNDASEFNPAGGTVFIGRGTQNFEGPITYTSTVNNGSFWEIQLASALEKDHLISDVVVDGQGTTDRLIPSGTRVLIPANNQSPEILFRTLRDAIIPAGEDTVVGVAITAILAGSSGNAGINTITQFSAAPFVGATVSNTGALTNGRDVETDDEFRERIKSYSNTLARGTRAAILAAIIGVSDDFDNKQVSSAIVTEPPKIGDPSIVYIDDSSGFEPSFTGQSVDSLLKDASGNEEFLQLANYPLPRPQSINTADSPFEMTDQMILNVLVDGVEESVVFSTSDFTNIASATLSEIIIAINSQAETYKARFTSDSSRILLSTAAHDAETIQVLELRSTDDESLYANNILKFPTNEFSYIKLYQNNQLLREQERSATLLTTPFNTWNITTAGNIAISVDGTPQQDVGFSTSDFDAPLIALELSDWVAAFNAKFAGMTAVGTSSGRMQITSNKEGSLSSIDVIGGSFFDIWFAGENTSAAGQDSQFQLNRQTGNIRILTDINAGDSITAGVEDAKGNAISSETASGAYNVSTDSESRPAEMVVVADSEEVTTRIGIGIAIGNIITITDEGSGVMRLTSDSATSFAAIQPHDYLYIASRGALSSWINPANSGLHRIISKGAHTTPNVDTYVEVLKANIVTGVHEVEASEDIQAFSADTYPQLWKGTFTTTPASSPIQEVVDSFDDNLVNVQASVFRTNSIKLSSTTEDGGSFATPVSVGNASLLFSGGLDEQAGNASHIANKISSSDMVSFYKRTSPTQTNADGVVGKNVWLDRYTYTDIKGALTRSVEPGEEGVETYSEELESDGILVPQNLNYDDYVAITTGANKGHYRSIRDILTADTIGTQHGLPRTLMDHVEGDNFSLFRPVGINSEDSIIFILDQDAVAKTIDIPMSREGRVNSDFPATAYSFSADDVNNEAGVTFGTLQVWGKDTNNTEFADYAVWMRARNWYASGGAGAGNGEFIIRAAEYGPHGENIRFTMEYPEVANFSATLSHNNNPGFTLATYTFGSGPVKPTGIAAADTASISEPSPDTFRYTFTNPIDLSTVVVGDILSIRSGAGFSTANSGIFRITAVDDALNFVEVHNPGGSSTGLGTTEITKVDTIDDVVGTPTISTVTTVAAGALDGTWVTLEDSDGTVAFYFDAGSGEPLHGADRSVKMTITDTETADQIAIIFAAFVNADPRFSATAPAGANFSITNTENGTLATAVDGGTGFTLGGGVGTADVSLDGLYFVIQDAAGSVAVWYDATGGTSIPAGAAAANRNLEVAIVAGDTADVVASKTAAVLNLDGAWLPVIIGGGGLNEMTIEDAVDGGRPSPSAATSGFTVNTTQVGINPGLETIAIPTSMTIYPLAQNSVADIAEVINASLILTASAVGDDSLTVDFATRDEVYVPAGPEDYSDSLSYGHNPDPVSGINGYVKLYDSLFHVKDFENSNPHFLLKSPMILQGAVDASTYSLETAVNHDTPDLGESFKLVPVTLDNVLHHFTQKALSQLPIVADIDIANNIRSIQVKSKLLGSEGAVEVIGGNANSIGLSIFDAASEAFYLNDTFTEVKTAAYPVTLTSGDLVTIRNDISAKRASRLTGSDRINVVKLVTDDVEYHWAAKDTKINEHVRFDISDVSASYSRPAGNIWRWTHNDGGSVFNVTDKTLGAPATAVADWDTLGTSDATELHETVIEAGDGSNYQNFEITVSALPTQGDYFAFESADGTTFAVWFDIDGAGTAPTGGATPFGLAANQIEVDISSGDTEDQIMSALAATLLANVPFTTSFTGVQELGANFTDVVEGDILNAYGTFSAAWDVGNKAGSTGGGNIAGFPIIAVDAGNRYVDVVNPRGAILVDEAVGATATVQINPTPVIQWPLTHGSNIEINTIIVTAGTASVSCVSAHGYKVGDLVDISENSILTAGEVSPVTVTSVPSPEVFEYASAVVDETYDGGRTLGATVTPTRYKIEKLGFNNLFRLVWVDGDTPRFVDNGVAVDDFISIKGNTFRTNNAGIFRVLGVDNNSIIFQNNIGIEELDTIRDFNSNSLPVTFTSNSDIITGSVAGGSFANLQLGDWVKKGSDSEDLYLQVVGFKDIANLATLIPEEAVSVQLAGTYEGTTSTTLGVAFDQANDVGKGRILDNPTDITFYEGDSVRTGDSLFVDNIADSAWFSAVNTGTFEISQFATDPVTHNPIVVTSNPAGSSQLGVDLSVDTNSFFILEGPNNKYESIRLVNHTIIDQFNENRRVHYLSPPGKEGKLTQANGTSITPIGKLDYQSDIVTGIDGYTYYTGLLRTVQRIIDGFEPDPSNFPGRRAVGGIIEILPPLIRRVQVSIDVTTNEGVNINEISNDITSSIINYIDGLDVGGDVILSEIIVEVMSIKGVEAATFNTPDPSTERIAIADDEKAYIEVGDISVS